MRKQLFVIFLLICATSSVAQELSVKEFREATTDISARTLSRQDINEHDCALIKVQLAVADAVFIGNVVGDTHYLGSEYWVYMAEGSKHLKINTKNFLPIDITFADYGITKLTGKTTYVLKILLPKGDTSKFKQKAFNFEPKVQIGQMMAVGVSIGGFYRHFNAELTYLFGLTESEEIFWNTTEGGNPYSYTYKPFFFVGKVGYAFYVGKPFRITPQIGLGSVQISGSENQTDPNQADASKGYSLNASISTRFDYLILPWLGIGIAPQYSFPLKKSDLFNRVSEVSSKVKGYANGFNVDVNLFVTF